MSHDHDDSPADDIRRGGTAPGDEQGDSSPASDPAAGSDGAASARGGAEDVEEEHVEPRIGVSESEHLAEIDHLRIELESERARTAELKDALMRTAADFDNFRKRMERDRVEERKQAAAGLVKNLLPVLDAVGRALGSASAAPSSPELAGFIEGIRMVESQLLETLRQAGLEPVPTDGTFDPVHHEALMQEANESVPHMTILSVFEPGYRLGGRLLRPARVKVAYNPGGVAEGAARGSSGEGNGEA